LEIRLRERFPGSNLDVAAVVVDVDVGLAGNLHGSDILAEVRGQHRCTALLGNAMNGKRQDDADRPHEKRREFWKAANHAFGTAITRDWMRISQACCPETSDIDSGGL
jgi:hypothetical protein